MIHDSLFMIHRLFVNRWGEEKLIQICARYALRATAPFAWNFGVSVFPIRVQSLVHGGARRGGGRREGEAHILRAERETRHRIFDGRRIRLREQCTDERKRFKLFLIALAVPPLKIQIADLPDLAGEEV